jgi:hypothetical protein
MPSPDHLQKVIHHLFRSIEGQTPQGVYALLDAARDDAIYQEIVNSDVENVCLYQGEKAVELATVAPYLIRLKRENSFTPWLLSNGWGKSWGIFVQSPASFNELRQHFRTFLMVYDEEGKPLYFRYYDPRVLQVYLPTCNESELKTVFGPITRYLIEGEESNQMVTYFLIAGQLTQETVRLVA